MVRRAIIAGALLAVAAAVAVPRVANAFGAFLALREAARQLVH